MFSPVCVLLNGHASSVTLEALVLDEDLAPVAVSTRLPGSHVTYLDSLDPGAFAIRTNVALQQKLRQALYRDP